MVQCSSEKNMGHVLDSGLSNMTLMAYNATISSNSLMMGVTGPGSLSKLNDINGYAQCFVVLHITLWICNVVLKYCCLERFDTKQDKAMELDSMGVHFQNRVAEMFLIGVVGVTNTHFPKH